MVTITQNTIASTTLLCLLLVNVLSLYQPRSIKGICQKGWKYYETENVCIYYTLARKPGKSAGEVCRSRGAKLVNITTDHKKAFVVRNRPSTKYENWIDSYYEDPKEWSPFNLLTGDSQGQCVKVKADSEKLIRGSCDSYHRFVCEKQQGKNATCPRGWKLYSDAGKSVCLIGVYTVKNCQGATAHCKNLNAVLAMPKTENKFDAILGARPNKNWPMFVGIKMTSKTAKAAAFADGTKLKSCRVIEHDAKGISGYMDCNLSRRIICEKARASGPYQHK